jgi:hypothetical protein
VQIIFPVEGLSFTQWYCFNSSFSLKVAPQLGERIFNEVDLSMIIFDKRIPLID